jgi:hypothetical protein
MFAVISSLHFAFVYVMLPETKGKSLEEIEALFLSSTVGVSTSRPTGDGETLAISPTKSNRNATSL